MSNERIGGGLARRWSSGHLLMLAAGLLGAVSTAAVLRQGDDRTEVVVAASDLAIGQRIESADLTTTAIPSDAPLLKRLVAAAEGDDLVDMIVTAPIERGSPVLPEQVRSAAAPDGARAMSFSLPIDRAVGGALGPGDRIDVLAVDRDGRVGYALADALVMRSDDPEGDAPLRGSGDGELTLTVAVDADGARRLAGALAEGDITIVRSTGAETLDDVEWYEPTGERASTDA